MGKIGGRIVKKIGFIDYYLDEWHANNYPAWIRENVQKQKKSIDVAYAWAEIDLEGGLNTESWCEKYKIQSMSSIEELIEKSDYLIVLSPDHPEHHERLGRLALMSGKPVYMDKTFSPDLETGKRMFELAEQYKTPLFSSSALRFSKELSQYSNFREKIEYVATTGPGTYKNYSVHQFEMIVALMGVGAKRLKSVSTDHANLLIIEYENGRQASYSQMSHAGFTANIQFNDGEGVWVPECSNFFPRLIDSILGFFETGIPPVPKKETLEIMSMIDAGKKALNNRDTWIEIDN